MFSRKHRWIMNILAENDKFIVWNDYEIAYLTIKDSGKDVVIGDFYGDAVCAMIDAGNRYCVIGGCGVIVYYLTEPYMPYRYGCSTAQWTEYYREGDYWVKELRQIDRDGVMVKFESGENVLIYADGV